ncbi:MAG: polyphosphate polymerase domain-containing protein, partial [Candidatus Bathyarchaeota archaeon]|nr:polyphosphate polymerase domain-containing protein [Candidatus Bathyarchaeum sp.]
MSDILTSHLRHEHKYPLTFLEYQILKKKLAIVLKPDKHAGPDNRYHIRSLYFDDFQNSAMFEKQAGLANRSKYRMRIYNCSDESIKLERKTKQNQFVHKDCVMLTRGDADRIIAGDVDFLGASKNGFLKKFYSNVRNNFLRPVVIVDYVREAYVHPIGNVRITFDTELHMSIGLADFFNSECSTTGIPQDQNVTLEVKFDDVLPSYIRGLFPSTICPQCSLGKF